MMGHVPRRVGHDAGPVGSRAFERPYRDRPASWRLVSSWRARIMADGTISWFAGVDWGSQKHQVCLLDAAGQVVGERAFRHGGAGLAVLSGLAPLPLADEGSVGYRAASHRGADADAVLGMRIGSCDGATRAPRPGLSPVPLPHVRQAVQ